MSTVNIDFDFWIAKGTLTLIGFDNPGVSTFSSNCSARPKLNLLKLCKDISYCNTPCPPPDPNDNECAILFAQFVLENVNSTLCYDSWQQRQMTLCECAASRVDTYCSDATEHQWIKSVFAQWVEDNWGSPPPDCCSNNFAIRVKHELEC